MEIEVCQKSKFERVIAFLAFISIFSLSNFTTIAEPPKATQVVSLPLTNVSAAIISYATNSVDPEKDFFQHGATAITNSLGETGLRYGFYSCRTIPMAHFITVTTVATNITRLEVEPGPLEENFKGFKSKDATFDKQSNWILNGVIKTLNQKH